MKIEWMSQLCAEEINPSTHMAVISITGMGTVRKLKDGWGARLDADFNDFLKPLPEDPKYDALREYMFNETKAEEIARFVKTLPPAVNRIVIHCQHGISRSASVAKVLCAYFKEPFPEDYKYCNPLVLALLMEAFT
jgi:predicted protein tyrosine phosphatase